MNNHHLRLIAFLRQNGRTTLAKLATHTNTPISTVFDRIRESKAIARHTILLNYPHLGFNARAIVLLKATKTDKPALQKHLQEHSNINTLTRINNGHDYILECIFRTMNDLETFLDNLTYKYNAKATVHYLVNELKKEAFLANPEMVHLL